MLAEFEELTDENLALFVLAVSDDGVQGDFAVTDFDPTDFDTTP